WRAIMANVVIAAVALSVAHVDPATLAPKIQQLRSSPGAGAFRKPEAWVLLGSFLVLGAPVAAGWNVLVWLVGRVAAEVRGPGAAVTLLLVVCPWLLRLVFLTAPAPRPPGPAPFPPPAAPTEDEPDD